MPTLSVARTGPATPLRLLVLTSNPDRASFRQRVSVYRDILAEGGVHTEVAVLPPGVLARRRLFRRARDFDAVFLHKKKLNLLDARELRRCSRRIIYNFDDAIMWDAKRPACYSRAHYVPFRRTVRLADMVIAGSEYLAAQARPFNANVRVLPIGLNTQEYGLCEPSPARNKVFLVWIGSGSTLGYLSQIGPALQRVASRFDNLVLRVIGDEFPDLPGIVLECMQWSPQTRRVGLATADIGLAPLPKNPFTMGKCSFKVLEYSASGLPVVASPVGTNVEHVVDGRTGFLAERDDDWVEHLTCLVRDPERRRRMGQEGRRHAAQYDIRVIGRRFAELLRQDIEGSGSAA